MISKTIDLWENLKYSGEAEDNFRPTMDTYVLKGDKKRGAVLICPGGGYGKTSPREAEPIALKFNAAGFHAFVLYYSCAPRRHPQPLLDISRAMCIIRNNAEEWQVNTDKIAVCGFSAGGHLVASLGVFYDKPYLKNIEGIDAGLNKPNALILVYPVISTGEFAHKLSFERLFGENPTAEALEEASLENAVSDKVPPTFLMHTYEDASVPIENSLLFAAALRKNKVPFEMHIYPRGPHGISLATEETRREDGENYPHVANWIGLCIEWLKDELDFFGEGPKILNN